MVGTKAILVVAVVDGDLDGNRGIDQTNDSGGDSNVVCVAAVCGTRKAVPLSVQSQTTWNLCRWGA
jgi:hypothetical protein